MIFKEQPNQELKSYEVIIESINPCGGSAHGFREFLEIETVSPEDYVKANAKLPVTDITTLENGDINITTGNEAGYMTKYFFTEI